MPKQYHQVIWIGAVLALVACGGSSSPDRNSEGADGGVQSAPLDAKPEDNSAKDGQDAETAATNMTALSKLIAKIDLLCAAKSLKTGQELYAHIQRDPLVVNRALAASQELKRMNGCLEALKKRASLNTLSPDERLRREIEEAKRDYNAALTHVTTEYKRYTEKMLDQYRDKQCTKSLLKDCLGECKEEKGTCLSGAAKAKERSMCSKRGKECTRACKEEHREQDEECRALFREYKPVHEKELDEARIKFNETKADLMRRRDARIQRAKRNRSYVEQPELRTVHQTMDIYEKERQALMIRLEKSRAALNERLKEARCPDRNEEGRDLIKECNDEGTQCMEAAGSDRQERRACTKETRRCKGTVNRELDQMLRECKRDYLVLKKTIAKERKALRQKRRDALNELKKRQDKAVGDLRAPRPWPTP